MENHLCEKHQLLVMVYWVYWAKNSARCSSIADGSLYATADGPTTPATRWEYSPAFWIWGFMVDQYLWRVFAMNGISILIVIDYKCIYIWYRMILDIYAHVVAILKSNSLEALEASNTPRKKPLGKKKICASILLSDLGECRNIP